MNNELESNLNRTQKTDGNEKVPAIAKFQSESNKLAKSNSCQSKTLAQRTEQQDSQFKGFCCGNCKHFDLPIEYHRSSEKVYKHWQKAHKNQTNKSSPRLSSFSSSNPRGH